MKFIKRIYLLNLAYLILPLLIITITIYVVGYEVFEKQMHERNELYLSHLEHSVYTALDGTSLADNLGMIGLQDGVIVLADRDMTLIAGAGEGFQTGLFQEFLGKAVWTSKQGAQYILGAEKYYLYYHPLSGTGYTMVYFRPKRLSELGLIQFRQTLIVGFFGLLFLFFYLQKNMTKRMVAPLEELIRMVQRLTGRQPLFSMRSIDEDEIGMIRTYMMQLQDTIRDRDIKLRRNLFSVMDVLIDLLEIKDSYTASHSRQVRKYSIAIAQMLGLAEQEVRDIAFAATLHDIGKIGVSHTILNKPGKLTIQEFAIIKQHPVVADEVLKNIEELEYIRKIIRHHHEKWDGTGYPDRLTCDEIPMAARVVSVADAFDAMTSDRPYRKALSFNDAIAILSEEKGRQFDPKVVDALVKYLYRQNLYDMEVAAAAGHE